MGRGFIKNGPKIKIYEYFFVEIEKKKIFNLNKNRTKG